MKKLIWLFISLAAFNLTFATDWEDTPAVKSPRPVATPFEDSLGIKGVFFRYLQPVENDEFADFYCHITNIDELEAIVAINHSVLIRGFKVEGSNAGMVFFRKNNPNYDPNKGEHRLEEFNKFYMQGALDPEHTAFSSVTLKAQPNEVKLEGRCFSGQGKRTPLPGRFG